MHDDREDTPDVDPPEDAPVVGWDEGWLPSWLAEDARRRVAEKLRLGADVEAENVLAADLREVERLVADMLAGIRSAQTTPAAEEVPDDGPVDEVVTDQVAADGDDAEAGLLEGDDLPEEPARRVVGPPAQPRRSRVWLVASVVLLLAGAGLGALLWTASTSGTTPAAAVDDQAPVSTPDTWGGTTDPAEPTLPTPPGATATPGPGTANRPVAFHRAATTTRTTTRTVTSTMPAASTRHTTVASGRPGPADPGTGGAPPDAGSTGGDTGSTGGDTGSTGGDTGPTGGDTGPTGEDTGPTGGDTGAPDPACTADPVGDPGADQTGADQTGADQTGADQTGADQTGATESAGTQASASQTAATTSEEPASTTSASPTETTEASATASETTASSSAATCAP